MLFNKKIDVIAATDKKLYFLAGGRPIRNPKMFELSLTQFISHEVDESVFSNVRENRSKILLIVPDHWFKHEFFPFKSQKASLIQPFLERKLKATYPNLPFVHAFFRYSCRQKSVDGPALRIFHLDEPNSFSLYEALCKKKLTPRWITTPALLWEERFKLGFPEFSSQAALFIHIHPKGVFLYFYFQGDFLFSREVALPHNTDRWDALFFEVNQSIYLFSQKAKSDLSQIYLSASEASFQERLSDFLGRPVQMIALSDATGALPEDLVCLEGLWSQEGVSAPGDAHSITHHKIEKDLKWRPVQWAGMLMATALLLIFAGEHQWLEERLADEIAARSRMRQQQPVALADYDAALVELTEDAKRPSAAHTLLNIVSSLPEDVLINEVKMESDELRLYLAATVYADTIEHFRQLLKNLIGNLNRHLQLSPPITIEDMTFNMEEIKNQAARADYKVACKINLP